MLTTRITFIHLITVLLITVLFCIAGCNKDKPIVSDEQKLNDFEKAGHYIEEIILPLVQLDSIRVIKIAIPQAFSGEFPDLCFCIGERFSSDYSKNTAGQVLNNVFQGSLPQTITFDASYKFNVSASPQLGYGGLSIETTDLDPGQDTCGYEEWFYDYYGYLHVNSNIVDYTYFYAESFKYYYDNGYKSIYIKGDFVTYKLFFHFEN